MVGHDETRMQFKEETDCTICSCSGNSRRFTPLPATLARLQKQHENILEVTGALLRSLKGKNRTIDPKSFMSSNPTIQFSTSVGKLIVEHQREEEHILIPIVDDHLDSIAGDLIRREHQEILEALKRLNDKLTQVHRIQNDSRDEAFKLASDFETLVREHFSHEENVVYWFVSLYLS